MKLCKNNLYVGALIGASTLVVFSALYKEGKNVDMQPTKVIEEKVVETKKAVKERPIIDEDILIDEEYINNEISSLGIVNESEKQGKSYRILRCIDENSYYKAMIVLTYVDYEIKDEKTITIYRVCDAFTKTELFKTNKVNEYFDIKNIYEKSECFSKYTIISLDSLDDTYKYTIIDNVSEEELSIIPNNINDCWINEYDIAKIYVSLISKDNRVSFNKNEDKVLTY